MQVDASGYAIMQTALIVNQLVHHPRGGRAACHKHDIIAHRHPTVPKILQRLHKITLFMVNPRHLVKENHLSTFRRQRFKIIGKCIKGICPAGQDGTFGQSSILLQIFRKISELSFFLSATRTNIVSGKNTKKIRILSKSVFYNMDSGIILCSFSPASPPSSSTSTGAKSAYLGFPLCFLVFVIFAT